MGYRIGANRILSDDLEMDVVYHCNLACRSCSHLSPLGPKKFVSPQQIERDLSLLAQCFHTGRFRILGGEPLLHPQLVEVAKAVRRSGIADKILLITNGTLLDRAQQDLWEEIDRVEIFAYPGHEPPQAAVEQLKARASAGKIELRVAPTSVFRETYSELPYTDTGLLQRVYDTCEMAHTWGCCSVQDGYFYKCPPAHALPERLAQAGWNPQQEGIRLDDPALHEKLSQYLRDPKPLAACRHCTGTVGKLFAHVEITRADWRSPQLLPPEQLVDRAALYRLEHPALGRIRLFFGRLARPSDDPGLEHEAEASPSGRALIGLTRKLGIAKAAAIRAFVVLQVAGRALHISRPANRDA